MKMGGMGGNKMPGKINTAGMQVIAIMPSTLMNDYIKQFVLTDTPPSNLLSYSPLRENPMAQLITSPYTTRMDWSANKNGHPPTVTTNNINELIALIERSKDAYRFRQGMVLLYAVEMTVIAQQVVDSLNLAGFQEVSSPSLLEANKKFPSMIAKCFEPQLRPDHPRSICKVREF
jgi:hypothetical protein